METDVAELAVVTVTVEQLDPFYSNLVTVRASCYLEFKNLYLVFASRLFFHRLFRTIRNSFESSK